MTNPHEKLALELLFKRLDKIEEIMQKIDDRLDKVDVTLAAQHISLETHIRRTELAEQRINIVELATVQVKSHVDNMKGAAKALVIVSGIVALLGSLYGLFKIVG
jgi:hypothetical protein